MDQRRQRRPTRRTAAPASRDPSAVRLDGADVVLVGYFSAKVKDFDEIMESAAGELTARGARIVGRFVQRRGVSHGGVRKMGLPLSSRTLLSPGKVREVAAACIDADAAVFVASLTGHQRRVLTTVLGCPVTTIAEIRAMD